MLLFRCVDAAWWPKSVGGLPQCPLAPLPGRQFHASSSVLDPDKLKDVAAAESGCSGCENLAFDLKTVLNLHLFVVWLFLRHLYLLQMIKHPHCCFSQAVTFQQKKMWVVWNVREQVSSDVCWLLMFHCSVFSRCPAARHQLHLTGRLSLNKGSTFISARL